MFASVCVCSQPLNGPICCGTCSSAVSFRLDSISAIPLTFSTKRRRERTKALTQSQASARSFPCKQEHTHAHMQIQTEMHRQTHVGTNTECSKTVPREGWQMQLAVLAPNFVARALVLISAQGLIKYEPVFEPSSLHTLFTIHCYPHPPIHFNRFGSQLKRTSTQTGVHPHDFCLSMLEQ